MKKIIFVLLLCSGFLSVFGQKQMNWWYFGNKAGLNFNDKVSATASDGTVVTGLPKAVAGPVDTGEGCFTLSNSKGELLMSSDGMNVYNKSNAIMYNGTGLHGDPSSTQSGIVIPMPGNSSKYYIVTVAATAHVNGIKYSQVDLSLRSGLGEVISKNVSMPSGAYAYENIAAVRHSNGSDYWLINRTNNKFLVWRITSAGITGPTVQTYTPLKDCNYGEITFSPQGDKFVSFTYYCNTVISGKFNPATGVVSSIKEHSVGTTYTPYGATFSPNGEWVYIGSGIGSALRAKFTDLQAGTHQAYSPANRIVNFKRASDNRVYGVTSGSKDLFVIMNPNDGGTVLKKMTNYLINNSTWGLPTFLNFIDIPVLPFSCMGNRFEQSVDISGAPGATKVQWDFGGGAVYTQNIVAGTTVYKQGHVYPTKGAYSVIVRALNAANNIVATETISIDVVDCQMMVNPNIRTDLMNNAILKLKL